MNIAGIHRQERPNHAALAGQGLQRGAANKIKASEHKPDRVEETARPVPGEEAEPVGTAEEAHQKETPGVIRLLEEGHFKGVADVRLRINFFDELSARALDAVQPVVESETDVLFYRISTQLDEFLTEGTIDESARESVDGAVAGFESALQDAVGSLDSPDGGGVEALTDSVQAVFEQLMESLAAALIPVTDTPDETDEMAESGVAKDGEVEVETAAGPSPTEETGGTENAGDPPAESPMTIEDALAALRITFDDALAQLRASLADAYTPYEPVAPTGNGVAFDKFLAAYNELRGLTPTVDQNA